MIDKLLKIKKSPHRKTREQFYSLGLEAPQTMFAIDIIAVQVLKFYFYNIFKIDHFTDLGDQVDQVDQVDQDIKYCLLIIQ